MAESGRSLGAHDMELAQELGARAGVALENARLYQTANARREELDAVLAALAEAVLVYDGSGRLRMGNQAALRTFGQLLPLSLDELSGSELTEALMLLNQGMLQVEDELYLAMAGLGTDEDRIFRALDPLAGDSAGLQAMEARYRDKYGDLIADLRGDLSGDDYEHALRVLRPAIQDVAFEDVPTGDRAQGDRRDSRADPGRHRQGPPGDLGALAGLVGDERGRAGGLQPVLRPVGLRRRRGIRGRRCS